MGFTIFESSGTFNPTDYGLVVGDMLHLIVVGGGGGGAGTSNLYSAGTAGGASSFGSILTAEGGLAPVDNKAVTPQSGSFPGAPGIPGSCLGTYMNSSGVITQVSSYSVYGGGGGDGWMPGVVKGRSGFSSSIFAYHHPFKDYNDTINVVLPQDVFGHVSNYAFGSGLLISAIPASSQSAGTGGLYLEYNEHTLGISGSGGIGYGAGGGGGVTSYIVSGVGANVKAGAGGNSGVIAQKDYLLTSTNPVVVTVGKGGAGGTGYAGGAGTNGCVAIFW